MYSRRFFGLPISFQNSSSPVFLSSAKASKKLFSYFRVGLRSFKF